MPGRATLALRAGASTPGPQASGRAAAIETKYASIGCNSAAVASSQRTEKSICVRGGTFLPAANVADRPQHFLETGELRLDLLVARRGVALRPRGDHDALGRRPRRVEPARGRHRCQQLPHLLGDERHHRMQQPQQRVERVRQTPAAPPAATPPRRSRDLTIST